MEEGEEEGRNRQNYSSRMSSLVIGKGKKILRPEF